MKNLLFMCSFVILTNLIFAQVSNQAEAPHDSIQHVEPSTSPANLSFYQAPQGFVVGTGFNGYFHALTQTSIVVTMIDNGTYINVKKAMTPEYFASNMLTKTNEFDIQCESGLKGVGYVAEFMLNSKKMIRQMIFIGDLNKTLWLSVTYPFEQDSLIAPELLKSYNTVSFTN